MRRVFVLVLALLLIVVVAPVVDAIDYPNAINFWSDSIEITAVERKSMQYIDDGNTIFIGGVAFPSGSLEKDGVAYLAVKYADGVYYVNDEDGYPITLTYAVVNTLYLSSDGVQGRHNNNIFRDYDPRLSNIKPIDLFVDSDGSLNDDYLKALKANPGRVSPRQWFTQNYHGNLVKSQEDDIARRADAVKVNDPAAAVAVYDGLIDSNSYASNPKLASNAFAGLSDAERQRLTEFYETTSEGRQRLIDLARKRDVLRGDARKHNAISAVRNILSQPSDPSAVADAAVIEKEYLRTLDDLYDAHRLVGADRAIASLPLEVRDLATKAQDRLGNARRWVAAQNALGDQWTDTKQQFDTARARLEDLSLRDSSGNLMLGRDGDLRIRSDLSRDEQDEWKLLNRAIKDMQTGFARLASDPASKDAFLQGTWKYKLDQARDTEKRERERSRLISSLATDYSNTALWKDIMKQQDTPEALEALDALDRPEAYGLTRERVKDMRLTDFNRLVAERQRLVQALYDVGALLDYTPVVTDIFSARIRAGKSDKDINTELQKTVDALNNLRHARDGTTDTNALALADAAIDSFTSSQDIAVLNRATQNIRDFADIQRERNRIDAFNDANEDTTGISDIDLDAAAVQALDLQGLRNLIDQKKQEIRAASLTDPNLLALQDSFVAAQPGQGGIGSSGSGGAPGVSLTNAEATPEYTRLRDRFIQSGTAADLQAVNDFVALWNKAKTWNVKDFQNLNTPQLKDAVTRAALSSTDAAFNRVIAPLRDDASTFARDPAAASTKFTQDEADRALYLVQNNLLTGRDLQHALALLLVADAQGLNVADLTRAIDGITDTSLDKNTYKQYAANIDDQYWIKTLLENPENMQKLTDAVGSLKENNRRISDLIGKIQDSQATADEKQTAQAILNSLGLIFKESFSFSDERGAERTVNIFEKGGATYFVPDTATVRDTRDDRWKKPTGTIKDADGNAMDVLGDDFYRELFREGIIDPSGGGNANDGLATLRFSRNDKNRLVLAQDDQNNGQNTDHQCAKVGASIFCS